MFNGGELKQGLAMYNANGTKGEVNLMDGSQRTSKEQDDWFKVLRTETSSTKNNQGSMIQPVIELGAKDLVDVLMMQGTRELSLEELGFRF
ncbi:hypothetical protein N7541_010845 [Penicillium brevicompactum]|uniref:Uncharacterized protein n=1 Tax=Penicillium brevicompactum TaxID=5074 RepID=A0A9W9UKA7_PENBR|nr:hypothetical protein N7541_010845 [Penicillium brevicompactum]